MPSSPFPVHSFALTDSIGSSSVPAPVQKNRVSLFRSIFTSFSLFKSRRNDVIIAPHSPLPKTPTFAPHSPGFTPSSPRTVQAYAGALPPPKSPRSPFDTSNVPASIRLGTPPKRASTMRGPERIGLGQRKASTPSVVGDHSIFNE